MIAIDKLFQKLGLIVLKIARDFLVKEVGDKINSIRSYQEEYSVSRGTIQNALGYLIEVKAIEIINRGVKGSYITKIDYTKLQELSGLKNIQGIMPLPYSLRYQGLATALYLEMSSFDMNLVYCRGSHSRIRLVEDGIYQFAICSKTAAIEAINQGAKVELAIELAPQSYLSKHILVFREGEELDSKNVLRVAYDKDSLDQSKIIDGIFAEKKNVEFIEMKTHQTINNLITEVIDVGIWNYDDLQSIQNKNISIKMLDLTEDMLDFSRAVVVVQKGDVGFKNLIRKYITSKKTKIIQDDVILGKLIPNY